MQFRRVPKVFALLFVAQLAVPKLVHAGGYEYPGAGTRSLGRGGAFNARTDDPMVLHYNPAGLAHIDGAQIGVQSNFAFLDACATRYGTYTDNIVGYNDETTRFGSSATPPPDGYNAVAYPRVCNNGPVGASPQLSFTWRLRDDLGVGIGIFTPNTVGNVAFGDNDGTVPVDSVNGGALPTPVRYDIIKQRVLLFYPTIGVGYSVSRYLSLGLSFGWGIGRVDGTNYVRGLSGEGPAGDIRDKLTAQDLFIPRVNFTAHMVPHDNLDVMFGFVWSDPLSGGGKLKMTAADYDRRGSPVTINSIDFRAPLPWQLSFGFRYADRIRTREEEREAKKQHPRDVQDSMSNERWDVELDVNYEINSRVDEFRVTLPKDAVLGPVPLPDQVHLPRQWKDQVAIRLGGDYNIIPGFLTARAGVSFETRGAKPAYMQIDFWPSQRVGLHTGLTFRLSRVDVSLAYAHLFQESVNVRADQARYPQVIAMGDAPKIVNAGRYTSNFDIVSVGATYHF